jgi:hypothetical protein
MDENIEFKLFNNDKNRNKDWSKLFRNNMALQSYKKSDKNSEQYLEIIYNQIKNNEFIDDIYNEDYIIFENNLKNINKDKYYYSELFRKVENLLNDDVSIKFIYQILKLNSNPSTVEEYTDFLKKNLFNSILFQNKMVEEKSKEFIEKFSVNLS